MRRDDSYDSDTPATQAQGSLAQLQILARDHPEILTDPTIQAAGQDPAKLQIALQGWQSRNGMDSNHTYDDSGTLQNSSWFSDNLPWITAAMGAGIGGAGLLTGGAAGGAAAAGTAGGDLASTTIGSGFVPAIEGGTGLGGAAGAGLASTTIGSGFVPAISGGTGLANGAAGATATGAGTSGKFFSSLSSLGRIAGADAAGAAAGRAQQAQAQQGQDRNAISLYNDVFQNNLKAPSTLASQTARGDLLANMQPASFSGLPSYVKMPQISGGLTPASLGPNSRNAGAALSREALLKLASSKFDLPTPPTLTPLPDASGYDDFTKNFGRAASYAGAAAPYLSLFGGR